MKSWKIKDTNSLNEVSFQCKISHLQVFFTVISGTILFKCAILSCRSLSNFVSKVLR